MPEDDAAPPLPGSEKQKGFWDFGLMITPMLIKVIYIVGAIVVTLGGVGAMVAGAQASGFWGFLMGLVSLVMGNVLWRVWCELLIVVFRILDTLKEIEGHVRPK